MRVNVNGLGVHNTLDVSAFVGVTTSLSQMPATVVLNPTDIQTIVFDPPSGSQPALAGSTIIATTSGAVSTARAADGPSTAPLKGFVESGLILANALRDVNGSSASHLDGGDGNDTLYAGARSDSLIGGNGYEAFHGGTGNALMFGGPGNDASMFDLSAPRPPPANWNPTPPVPLSTMTLLENPAEGYGDAMSFPPGAIQDYEDRT